MTLDHMIRASRLRRRPWQVTVALLWPVLAWPQQPPAAAPQTVTTPQSQIQVRVYEGFSTLGPVFGSRSTPLAVDVGVSLGDCPDGNTEVRALDIGGWNYQVASGCATNSTRGTIRVDAGSARTAPPAPRAAAQPGTIRCDPATWRCAPAP